MTKSIFKGFISEDGQSLTVQFDEQENKVLITLDDDQQSPSFFIFLDQEAAQELQNELYNLNKKFKSE